MKNNKKQQINWEERLFQTALNFITADGQNCHELSYGQISSSIRKAKKFLSGYKDKLENGILSDLIDK